MTEHPDTPTADGRTMRASQRRMIRRCSARIADLAEHHPETVLADGPGWTVGALAHHLAAVQKWAEHIVRERPLSRVVLDDRGDAGDDVADRLRTATGSLIDTLERADCDEECWSFGPQRNAAFWHRRQAHEATVHLYDASRAVGVAAEIDPHSASDGLAEYFDTFVWKFWRAGDWRGDGERCMFVATDIARVQQVVLRPDDAPLLSDGAGSAGVGHPAADGDLVVAGDAVDLLLAVWNRVPLTSLRVTGSDDAASAWTRRFERFTL